MAPCIARFTTALLALAIPAVASAQTKAPLPIVRWMQSFEPDCRAQRGRLVMTDTPFMEADFNGDRQPDYLVSEGMFECRDRRGTDLFAGNSGRLGPEIHFLISSPEGHRQVPGFSANPYELSIEKQGNREVLVVTPSHSYSGDVKRIVWAWNGQKMDIVERRNGKGQLVDQEGRVTAARPAASPPAGGSAPAAGFAVRVILTPQAVSWLKRQKDQPLVEVIYQGNPRRGTPAQLIHPAEDVILLGDDRIPLPLSGGTVQATGAGLDQSLMKHVQGSVEASVLVRQARDPRNAMDTVGYLSCSPEKPLPLTTLRAKGLSLTCGPP